MAVFALLAAGSAAASPMSKALAASVASASEPAAVADADWAASEADASAVAAAFGHPVGVVGESSPTTEVLALPDGQMQLVSDSVPQRVLVNGAWRPVDTSLVIAADGLWTPSAVPSGVELAAGGSDVMARIQAPDGSWAAQTWPDGVLPVPSVSGSTATYASVFPGVDLILGATPSGMSEVFEVHSAQAAADPRLQALELGVQDATLSQDSVNSTVATMASGSQIEAQEPLWWDSSAEGAGPAGPGAGEPEPVAHTVSATRETLDVSAIGADASVDYPVFVDPAWSSGDNNHWYDDKAYPNQSYLNGNQNASWLGTGAAVQSGISYLSRAFWQFPTSALAGKTVTGAHLTETETETWSTTDTVGLYQIQSPVLTPGATWNQENATANVWAHLHTTFTPVSGSNTQDVTTSMAWVANNSQANTEFALKATDESNLSDRKHWALNASLSVTYDTKPNAPAYLKMTAPVRGCGTSTAPVWVNNSAQSLTLEASLSDPDSSSNLSATFTVGGKTYPGSLAKGAPTAASSTAGLSRATVPQGTLTNGTVYSWHVVANDSIDSSVASGTCYFGVDNNAPAWPVVTTTATAFQVGTATAFTASFVSGDHVKELEYWWGGPVSDPVTTPVPAAASYATGALPTCPSFQGKYGFACASGTSITLDTAPTDTDAVLWVAAIDQAGNVSIAGTKTTTGYWQIPGDKQINPDPGVSATSGHQWITSGGVSSTTTVPDTNTSDEQDLALESGLGLTTVPAPGADPDDPLATQVTALNLPGYSVLERINNGTDHESAVEGAAPSGYHHELDLGEIGALDQAPPAGTQELYECDLSNSDHMTTLSATCEGQSGYSEVALGYLWTAAANVPAGDTAVALHRCRMASGGEHFDSTSSTCEGQSAESTLGYVSAAGVDATAAQAVDTTKSFTVAAWVYPEQNSGGTIYHTIMSESGPVNSAFYFQEAAGGSASTGTGGPLRICLRTQSGTAATTCATYGSNLPLHTWTLAVGIWDAANHQLSIHAGASLNGAGVAAYTVPSGDVSGNGPILIGSAISASAAVNQWDGLIMNPVVFPGVIDSAQLTQLYNLGPIS
ncbi:LamG-like jellyroll fold domain-containing protein [Gryllotalpicola koreensis]|uniref:LamG domain-containing protein n=1 Tax=Gryllotalpicola koreensis TaxID=993086 RepID=A0ABP7ZZM6_9MICO